MIETNPEIESKEEEKIFTSLRAQNWDEYHGQEIVKRSLNIAIEAARKRKEPLEHVLLYGPPGLGKTTLSHIISRQMDVNIRVTSGPAIERSGDLASIFTNMEDGDVLFIDEIHRLNKVVEEVMYPAMEDYAIDIILGKGPSARTVRLDLPRFTIIGATTRVGLLSAPLRDRFGVVHRLNFYTPQEVANIIMGAARKLDANIEKAAVLEIAKRSRGTPRIALRLLKRVRDYAEVHNKKTIDMDAVHKALDMLEIDVMGLNSQDKSYVHAIIEKHSGGPVGIETIAASISEDIGTVEDVIEPYLMQIGFLKRTPRGRVATLRAFKHFNMEPPRGQDKLL